MRADLKGEVLLGTVILATALLVNGGVLNQIRAVSSDVLGPTSPATLGLFLGSVGLAASLAGVAAAIVVDRRGPRWLMPLGALLAGVGFILLALAGSLWWLILASVVTSLGMAGVGVLYAVLLKGCYRIRGTVIGILVFGTSLGRTIASPLFDTLDPRANALVLAGLALVGAVFLFRMLPRVYPVLQHPDTIPMWRPTPEDERDLTGRGLMRLPGFWKVTGILTLVFALSTALSNHLRWWTLVEFHGDSQGIPYLLSVATAFGALFWGIASDYFRARFLIAAASLMAAVALGLFWLLTEQPGMVGFTAIGLTMGATGSLLWVLLADHVGVRFVATVGVAVAAPAGFLGGLSLPLLLHRGGSEAGARVMVVLAIALAIAAFRAPRLRFHDSA